MKFEFFCAFLLVVALKNLMTNTYSYGKTCTIPWPAAWNIWEVIEFYPREFYPFDNFAAFQIDYLGHRWPTSEHAYHAAKFIDTAPEVVELLKAARSPHDALKIAKEQKPRRAEDWDERKVAVMYEICRLKLIQNVYVIQKLELSADLEIVEDSPKDAF